MREELVPEGGDKVLHLLVGLRYQVDWCALDTRLLHYLEGAGPSDIAHTWRIKHKATNIHDWGSGKTVCAIDPWAFQVWY